MTGLLGHHVFRRFTQLAFFCLHFWCMEFILQLDVRLALNYVCGTGQLRTCCHDLCRCVRTHPICCCLSLSLSLLFLFLIVRFSLLLSPPLAASLSVSTSPHFSETLSLPFSFSLRKSPYSLPSFCAFCLCITPLSLPSRSVSPSFSLSRFLSLSHMLRLCLSVSVSQGMDSSSTCSAILLSPEAIAVPSYDRLQQ